MKEKKLDSKEAQTAYVAIKEKRERSAFNHRSSQFTNCIHNTVVHMQFVYNICYASLFSVSHCCRYLNSYLKQCNKEKWMVFMISFYYRKCNRKCARKLVLIVRNAQKNIIYGNLCNITKDLTKNIFKLMSNPHNPHIIVWTSRPQTGNGRTTIENAYTNMY